MLWQPAAPLLPCDGNTTARNLRALFLLLSSASVQKVLIFPHLASAFHLHHAATPTFLPLTILYCHLHAVANACCRAPSPPARHAMLWVIWCLAAVLARATTAYDANTHLHTRFTQLARQCASSRTVTGILLISALAPLPPRSGQGRNSLPPAFNKRVLLLNSHGLSSSTILWALSSAV